MWNAYVTEHNHQNIALVLFYFGNGRRASSQCIKRRKIRFSKTRIAYYSNSVATQALLLGGDVAKKPRTWPGKSGKYEKYSIQFENNTGQM